MRYLWGILVDFSLAWRLLTIVPLPFGSENVERPPGRSTAYYPLVGLILGLILAGVDRLSSLLLPEGLAAGLLLVVWVGLTGMLHLDGFMDTCDGLLPPRDPARRLEIMRDSQVGAFGVIGGVLLLLLKFNGLTALPVAFRWSILIAVPVLARWAMIWVMARYPLAQPEGLGAFFRVGLGWVQIIIASVIALGVALVCLGGQGIILLIMTWLTATLVAWLALARIHGLTGDIYGAICEITEMTLLILAVVIGRWVVG